MHDDLKTIAINLPNRTIRYDFHPAVIDHSLHIFNRTTFHSAPNGATIEIQQPMVLAKTQKTFGRVIEHLVGGARPDCACHWQKMEINKFLAIVLRAHECRN